MSPIIITLFNLPNQELKPKINTKIIELKINSTLGLPKAIIKTITTIRKNNVNIIHSFMFHANMISRIVKIFADVKVINSIRVVERKWPMRVAMQKYTSFLVDSYTPNSKTIYNYLLSKRFNPKKIIIIPNAIEEYKIEKSNTLKKELNLTKDWPIILSVANFRKQKDIPTTLRAIAKICKTTPVYYLHAGSGNKYENEMRTCLELIKDLKIEENVKILGHRSDIKDLLEIANIWTYATHFEGQSNALLQAMHHAKPIVCTNIQENNEVARNNIESLQFKPKDFKVQAKQILKLIKDRKLAAKLANNARKRVITTFTIKEHINKTIKLYEELLNVRN